MKDKLQRKRTGGTVHSTSHETMTSALTRGDEQQEEEKDNVQENQSISGYSQVQSFLF